MVDLLFLVLLMTMKLLNVVTLCILVALGDAKSTQIGGILIKLLYDNTLYDISFFMLNLYETMKINYEIV